MLNETLQDKLRYVQPKNLEKNKTVDDDING